jgi:predicted aconitase
MENKNKEQNPVALCKVINGTVYKVRVHFKEDGKEEMKDIIKRLLVREIQSEKI